MKRSVELLGGGVLGLVLGTVFLAHPIASALSTYARATWSLAGCPSGVYTLAATAQSLSGGQVYTLSTPVQVPHADVVQQFANVPPGQYSISASLRRANGDVVGSGSQVVNTTDEGVVILRSRAPSQPVRGIAGARWPQRPPATPSVTAPAPAITPVAPVASGPTDRTAAAAMGPQARPVFASRHPGARALGGAMPRSRLANLRRRGGAERPCRSRCCRSRRAARG